jgi:hypothetical protein
MSKPRLTALAASAGLVLGSCAGSHNSNSMPRGTESNDQKMVAAIRRVSAETAGMPHGPEIESGVPMTITDGNLHLIIPPTANVVRTAGGFTVTYSNGHSRKFSKNAVAVVAGEYHRYGPLNK